MMKKRIPHFLKFGQTAVRHRSTADGGKALSRETSEKINPSQEKDATNVKEKLLRKYVQEGSCAKSNNRILSARSVFMVLPRQSVQHRTYHVSSSNRNKMYDGSVLIDESQGQNSSSSSSLVISSCSSFVDVISPFSMGSLASSLLSRSE